MSLSASSSSASRPSTPNPEDTAEYYKASVKEVLQGLETNLPFALNSLQVVARRYLQRTPEGKPIETPEEMYRRVADALAAAECMEVLENGKLVLKEYMNAQERQVFSDELYELLSQFKFTPAGRTLANAGAPTRLVANCIVLHVEDSMKEIFQTLADAAVLQQSGSGLGFPLHLMRPAGSLTLTSKGKASGPVSFLHIYNTAFGVVKQDNRNGANMGVMRVDHPDILEFIHCKDREGDLSNFNVSVGLIDSFMQQVADNCQEPWMCEFNGEKMLPREIWRDANFNIVSITPVERTARQIFMQIVDSAWKTGEPGCVFLDTVNAVNPLPGLGRLEACNPCGEQFLHDGDVCNLGSLNLEKFVTEDRQVDVEELKRATKLAIRALDNVVDISDFPVDRVNSTARDNRRIGLGIMGFADMLYQMRIGYNTQEGRDVARFVMGTIQKAAEEMSVQLGQLKGVFANWHKSVFAESGEIRRNAALTNIAPTGTIAMMFNVSGGVEPYFALAYHYKGILGGDVMLQYFNKHLEEALRSAGCYNDEIVARINREGTLQKIDEIPEWVKKVFVTSMDISAEDHILMQAAMQENCDNAISKTINFPNSATHDDILRGYIEAWRQKCKGCTVYRDGSRVFQVLNLNKDEEEEEPKASEKIEIVIDNPRELENKIAYDLDRVILETEALERAITNSPDLSNRIDPKIKEALQEVQNLARDVTAKKMLDAKRHTNCPECDNVLVMQEGCRSCHSCGYSACSRA